MGANEFIKGDITEFDTVYNFGKTVDVLTFEIEKVNIAALKKLQNENVKVYPSPEVLELVQSKGVQKKFYVKNNIPTTPFTIFKNLSELKESIENGKIPYPFVWKSTLFGYDGYGVNIIKSIDDMDKLPEGECIAEELVSFKNELSVIVSRSVSGEIKNFPVVEMEFHPEANQVEYVLCPARISDDLKLKADKLATKVAIKMGLVGIMAVEIFQTQNDRLFVNEVAPRPHNSGHYTIEASYTSQFEQHLRAILDLPLGNTDNKLPAVMVNIVGKKGYQGNVHYKGMNDILKIKGVIPHLYGKKQTRPFRKMGHVTIAAGNIELARKNAEIVKNTLKVIHK